MAGLSFGDLAQSFALRSRITGLKTQSATLANELASGRKSDVASSLAGNLSGLSALERSRQILQGYSVQAQDAGVRTDGRQAALTTISTTLSSLLDGFSVFSQDGDPAQVARLAEMARDGFSTAVSALNTRIAGRSLFAGMDMAAPAIDAPSVILQKLAQVVAGATKSQDIASRIADWFNDPAQFQADVYRGAEAAPDLQIDPDGTAISDVTAEAVQIRKGLISLATAAFFDHPGLSPTSADRTELRDTTLGILQDGAASLTDLSARIGLAQNRIDASVARQHSQALGLELKVSELVSADPARTATELEAVRTNLETVYAVTARLSRLSLAEFLR